MRVGTGVPNRLSSRVDVHTQVKGIAAVMLTPKKLGGNKYTSPKSPTYKCRELTKSLKPQFLFF